MPQQEGHAGEGLGAAAALVFPGVRVRLQVGPEVGAVREGPAALRAGIGLLSWGRGRPSKPASGVATESIPRLVSLFINDQP